jgi:hypothetical protein
MKQPLIKKGWNVLEKSFVDVVACSTVKKLIDYSLKWKGINLKENFFIKKKVKFYRD